MVFLYFLYVLSAPAGLVVNVAGQLLICRARPRMGLLKSVIGGFAAGLAATVVIDVLILVRASAGAAEIATGLVLNSLIYSSLGYCYFHFLNLGETARRIRILRELLEAPAGLTMPELLDRYNAQVMVKLRLARLVDTGQVVERDERYFIGNPPVLRMARAVVWLKGIVLGKRSEFK